jgi:nitric oxide dioxygenase
MRAAKYRIFRAEHDCTRRDAAPGIQHRGLMSPESERLVRESWEALLPASDAVVARFYARLFESNPDLEKLFRPANMAEQRRKFVVMLSEIVRVIDTPDLLISEVADSGRRHVAYGVQDRDYEDVGAALIWAIADALGDRCTPEIRDAWREAYDLLAAVMRRAAMRTSGVSFPAVARPPESGR